MTDQGYEVSSAGDGKSGLKHIAENAPDLVLLDYFLPDYDGLTMLKEIRKIADNLVVIILTAHGNVKNAVESMKAGAFDFVEKTGDFERLTLLVSRAFNTLELTHEVKRLKTKLHKDKEDKLVIGESKSFDKLIKQASLVAKTNMSVFIEGETGTGKELLAEYIHKNSERKDAPFVAVDCGAIPETLFESEMFGHEKGAFTDAHSQRTGKFEEANKGTIFLDEVCNLPLNQQIKLLRVIQERKVSKIGGKKPVDLDLRIIAACNKDIGDLIKKEMFKDDLFYRINEFKLLIPPLRERRDDIFILSEKFLEDANIEFNKQIIGIGTDAMNMLLHYHWPGNIRELKNIIRKASLLCDSPRIHPEHLVFESIAMTGTEQDTAESLSINEATRKTKIYQIKNALVKAKGNKTRAAELLGMSRRQLYRDIEKFDIEA